MFNATFNNISVSVILTENLMLIKKLNVVLLVLKYDES